MNNPYISYKVIGTNFTYKRFNKDNIVVVETLPLFENGKINPVAAQIVENVRQNIILIQKNKENNNQKEQNILQPLKEQNKNMTLVKLEIKAKLKKALNSSSKEEANEIIDKISSEYGITLAEIDKIYIEMIMKDTDDKNLIQYAVKDEQAKIKYPERNTKISSDEYQILDRFMQNEVTDEERKNLRRSVKKIEEKYQVSFIQLRTIYRIEKHTRSEKQRVQELANKKQKEVSENSKKRDTVKKIIASFPDNITNDEITSQMEKIGNSFNIPQEELFDLYEEVKNSKKEKSNNKKTLSQLFSEKIEDITKEEIEKIEEFLSTIPPTEELAEIVEEIRNKYHLSEKELILAYTIKKKEFMITPQKRTVIKNSKLKTQRTAKKLEDMILSLHDQDLSENEIEKELNKLSKTYNVTQLQMGMLYKNAFLKEEYDNLSKQVSKKLTGQKIPGRKKVKKEELENKNLGSNDSKQEFIEAGLKLVIPSKQDEWKEMVEQNYHNPVPIYTAINVMSILNRGEGIRKARKEIEQSHNFEINKKEIVDIVSTYSPYGQEFAKKTRKYIMSNPERLLKSVLSRHSEYENTLDDDIDIESVIAKLHDLKNAIISPEDMDIDNIIEPPLSIKQM